MRGNNTKLKALDQFAEANYQQQPIISPTTTNISHIFKFKKIVDSYFESSNSAEVAMEPNRIEFIFQILNNGLARWGHNCIKFQSRGKATGDTFSRPYQNLLNTHMLTRMHSFIYLRYLVSFLLLLQEIKKKRKKLMMCWRTLKATATVVGTRFNHEQRWKEKRMKNGTIDEKRNGCTKMTGWKRRKRWKYEGRW